MHNGSPGGTGTFSPAPNHSLAGGPRPWGYPPSLAAVLMGSTVEKWGWLVCWEEQGSA